MTYKEMIKEMDSLGYDTSKNASNKQNKMKPNKSIVNNNQQPQNTKFSYNDMLKEMSSLGYKVPKAKTIKEPTVVKPSIKPTTIKPTTIKPVNTPARPSQVPSNVKAPTYDTMGYSKLTDKKPVSDAMRPASITSVGEYIHKAIGDKAYKDLPKVGFYRGQEKPKSNTGVKGFFGMQSKEEIAASKAMGEWAKKYPKEYHVFMQIHNNDYDPTKGDAFIFGLGESATLGATDIISKLYDKSVSNQYNININDTRSDQAAKAYPKLSGAGKLLGYVSPGIAVEIPAKVALKGVTKKVASKVAANAIEGAVIGGGLGAAEGIVRQEKPKDILKRTATNAAFGGVLGGGITATAGYFKGLRNSLKNPLNQNVPVKLEFVSAAVPDKVKPSSKGSWTVKNSEYNQALNDYNNAIELVHNEFKTNEFRTNEMPLVHQYLNEQGYNLDDILTRMEQSESKTSSQIMKTAAEKAKYKRASGLGSDKVTKVIDNTLEMKPTMNMLNKKMFGKNFPVPGEQVAEISQELTPELPQAKIQPKEIRQDLQTKLNNLNSHYEEFKRITKNDKILDSQQKASRLKALGMQHSAEKRALIQGDSLEYVEGGLTGKELQKRIQKDQSNYVGKQVIIDGQEATVVNNPYGKVQVKLKNGTLKTVTREQIKPLSETSKEVNVKPSGPIPPKINPPKKNVPLEQGKSRFSQQVKYNSTLSKSYKKVAVEPDYTVVKDKAAWEYAKDRIKNDEGTALNELLTKTNKNKNKSVDKNDVVLSIELLQKYSREGKYELANAINDKISLELTNGGQIVQAAKLLSKNTPYGMVRYAKSQVNKAVESMASAKEKELLKTISELQTKIDNIKLKQEVLKSKPRTKNIISQLNDLNDQLKVNLQLFGQEELKLPAKYKNAKITAADEKYILKQQEKIQGIADDELRVEETAMLTAYIANKIPVTLGRKLETIQTISQLLNTITPIRNVVGNAAFMALDDATKAFAGRPIDKAISLITKQRTNKYGLDVLGAEAKGLVKGFKAGGRDSLKGIDTAGFKTQYDIPASKSFQGQYKKAYSYLKQGNLFKASVEMASATMSKLETGLSLTLRTFDRAFYQAGFNGSIKNSMKVNGIKNVSDVTEDMLLIAHQDGWRRTFQDKNLLSDAFSGMKRWMNFKKDFGFGSFVLKYPKAPANIAMRAIDYSPAGILKAAYNLRDAFKFNPLKPKTLLKIPSQFKTELIANQRQVVENLSQASVGSGLMALSYVMYSVGILTGKRPKNLQAEELLKETGQGQYGFNYSAFNRWLSSGLDPNEAKPQKDDVTFNYDWFQPIGVNVAAGANIGQQTKEKGKVSALDVMRSVVYSSQASIDTLSEQPVMQGVTRMFQYGEFSENLKNIAASAPASFVPTFVNQVRKFEDNSKRITATDNKDIVNGTVERAMNLIKNKIPGLSKTLSEQYSTTGKLEENYQNGSNSLLNVFFNPAFVRKYNTTPGTQMILDLYNNTGDTKQFTKKSPDYITVENTNGKRLILTQKQKNELQQFMGKTAVQELDKISTDIEFNTATDDQKVDILGRILQRVGTYSRKYLLQKLGEEYIVKNIK